MGQEENGKNNCWKCKFCGRPNKRRRHNCWRCGHHKNDRLEDYPDGYGLRGEGGKNNAGEN